MEVSWEGFWRPRCAPRCSKTAPRRPKTPQDRLQDAPRRPQDTPKRPQDAPRHPKTWEKRAPKNDPKPKPLQTTILERFGLDLGAFSEGFLEVLRWIWEAKRNKIDTQRATGSHRGPQKATESHWEKQRATESHGEPQRAT